MSLNTAHTPNGFLIHAGEQIVLYAENVVIEFGAQDGPEFKGSKHGKASLTTHRLIFACTKKNDPMQSFSFPFVALSDLGLEQPVFGANYLRGNVSAQPNGNWTGMAKFKMTFKNGGAVEFAQSIVALASFAKRFNPSAPIPPYVAPDGPWHPAPPPAYSAHPGGYYGWVPPTAVFPSAPPAAAVFMVDSPPPYSGIFPAQNTPYAAAANPPPQDAKAAEAAQSAYYDPNRPQYAYVPPPAYYEKPPTYEEATGKKNQ